MIRPYAQFLLACLALAALLPQGPVAAQSRFASEDGAYSLDLPSGFVRIPPPELFLFEHPGKSGPVPMEELATFRRTHAGFQKKAETWFTPPLLLVTRESGKRRTPKDLFMDHVLAERDRENAAPSGTRFLEKEHFPTKRVHYYKETGYNRALGRQVVSGVYTYLTSDGFLRLTWYLTEDQRADYEEALHQAAMSLTLSPEATYKTEQRQ